MPLYEKYHDDTNPVREPKEKILAKIEDRDSDFYFIYHGEEAVGGISNEHKLHKRFL